MDDLNVSAHVVGLSEPLLANLALSRFHSFVDIPDVFAHVIFGFEGLKWGKDWITKCLYEYYFGIKYLSNYMSIAFNQIH